MEHSYCSMTGAAEQVLVQFRSMTSVKDDVLTLCLLVTEMDEQVLILSCMICVDEQLLTVCIAQQVKAPVFEGANFLTDVLLQVECE